MSRLITCRYYWVTFCSFWFQSESSVYLRTCSECFGAELSQAVSYFPSFHPFFMQMTAQMPFSTAPCNAAQPLSHTHTHTRLRPRKQNVHHEQSTAQFMHWGKRCLDKQLGLTHMVYKQPFLCCREDAAWIWIPFSLSHGAFSTLTPM